MKIKLLSIASTVILAASMGTVGAGPVRLSGIQLDTVTAGASQSASASQITGVGAAAQYQLAVSAKGDSAVANATVVAHGYPPVPAALPAAKPAALSSFASPAPMAFSPPFIFCNRIW